MPLFKTQSAAIFGIDAGLIDVEVDMLRLGAEFIMVGMPDIAVPGEPGAHRIGAAELRVRLSG